MNLHLRKLALSAAIAATLATTLTGCGGDDGKDGANGAAGEQGLVSLISHTAVAVGDDQCFNGGVKVESGVDADADGMLSAVEVEATHFLCHPTVLNTEMHFNRIASFPVCQQLDENCDTDDTVAAEIVAASTDGMTLVYTDSPGNTLGFVDISKPEAPEAAGMVALAGEPTSVAVKDGYALVAINQSTDFINVAGQLKVLDMNTRAEVASLDLGGQPDSVAVSPDGQYAAVVIENERDEDLGDGIPPQMPAGDFVIVNTSDANPENWTLSHVDITGVADLFAGDPEPEYVDINEDNIAVVTLQENNHIILIDLADGSIVNDFSAGTVDLDNIDLTEGKPLQVSQTESQDAIPREPDGVSWINSTYFATADEGDMNGGSRGFTIFNKDGDIVWRSGNTLDHMAARLGHYPDKRSGNKGNEPENIEMGIYQGSRYLFVNSERSSLVFVYDVANPKSPVLKQVLPAGVGPEGGLSIPSRNLLVVASEEDARDDKIRSALNVYQYDYSEAAYPTLVSTNRENGAPIPWAAMSGLSADSMDSNVLYAVEDSFYASTRIFKIDVNNQPARLVKEMTIKDSNDVFAGFATSGETEDETLFDSVDLAAMINEDKSVNIDAEGIAMASDGGFWVASEGAGTLTDTENRPLEKLNFIFKTDAYGIIEDVITLPEDVNDLQIRFGFEGIAEYNGKAYVAFQRAWEGEANPRIGIYDVVNSTWEFVYYPLDAVESQNAGWVGLSDITSLGDGTFLVLERDNQGGPDAAIKRFYTVDIDATANGGTLVKTLARDILDDLKAPGGLVAEKVEGAAVMKNGDVYIINDNDGVDDNSGETQLINLGDIL